MNFILALNVKIELNEDNIVNDILNGTLTIFISLKKFIKIFNYLTSDFFLSPSYGFLGIWILGKCKKPIFCPDPSQTSFHPISFCVSILI